MRTIAHDAPCLSHPLDLEHIAARDAAAAAVVLPPGRANDDPAEHKKRAARDERRGKVPGPADELVANNTGAGRNDAIDKGCAAHDGGEVGGRKCRRGSRRD